MRNFRKRRFAITILVIAYALLCWVSNSPESTENSIEADHGWQRRFGEQADVIVVLDERMSLKVFGPTPDIASDFDSSLLLRESHSVEECAIRLKEELSALENFHIVAHGYGAAIALRYNRLYPGDLESISLISPRGLIEFEPLGSGMISRSLRSAEAMIHMFGDLCLPFSLKWIPSRSILKWNAILAARSDFALTREDASFLEVPVAVLADTDITEQAAEFFRIIPQSRWLQDFSEVGIFLQEAAFDREKASASRVLKAQVPFYEIHNREFVGPALVTAMILIALSTLISEDLACVGSGILVSQGAISFGAASISCFLGILGGDMLLFFLGWIFGESVISNRPFRWVVSSSALAASEKWFQERGLWVLFLSRFMPGSRVPVFFAAGVLKARPALVSAILAGAALLWVPMLVLASVYLGQRIFDLFARYEQWAFLGIVVVFACIFLITHKLLPLFTYRGRRLAYSKMVRFVRWEFWPAKAIYPPVVVYILFKALKARCLSLFTLVNPMFACGGLVDESKSEILSALKDAGAPVADFTCIHAEQGVDENLRIINSHLSSWGIPFPVVLKPDVGERGKDVRILKNEDELVSALREIEGKYIIQKYVGGCEFGVFYYRIPGQPTGNVSSITRKQYTAVTGDGETDLEHLILSDKRAVCCAKAFLKAHEDRLFTIPSKGEKIKLVEIGTHSRGSLFLDAGDLVSDELVVTLDSFCKAMKGYYYGRFDLKVPSEDALKKGENLTIIELNLLTSEPTHIYDPKHSLGYAWKTLIAHWRTVFEISKRNKEKGLRPLGVRGLFDKIMRHYF